MGMGMGKNTSFTDRWYSISW